MNRRVNLIASVAVVAAGLLLPSAVLGQGARIAATKHNLTGSGPGPIRVAGLNNICSPCHTPHSSNPIAPLWNRRDSGTYYQVYTSPTLTAVVPQPTGSSRLCLSCHDGTIALGQTYNHRQEVGGSLAITAGSSSYLGTDLRDDHPISFVYDSALAMRNTNLNDPLTLSRALRRDREDRLQCTTCHDPHDGTRRYFLTMDNHRSAMCRSCHNLQGWTAAGHANSAASVGSAGSGRWTRLGASTVGDLACEACHRPHSAGGREWLLYSAAEEDNCYACHNGAVAKNVAAEFLKVGRHPVELATAVHSPNENPSTMTMHVKCGDCHNPHQATASPAAVAPYVQPQMKGVSGLRLDGASIKSAVYEYEVCYKCHGWRNPATPVVNRVISEPSVANRFNLSNASFHPVAAQGRNTSVPSLLIPRKTTDRMYCTDCHGSDSTTVRGPHGSTYRPLLVKNYTTNDNTAEGPAVYALCYTCHDRNSILANASFPTHRKHIVDQRTPCSICHDAHGVLQNTNLINFDRDRVTAVNGVGPTFKHTGVRRGSCTLQCHGKVHVNKQYP